MKLLPSSLLVASLAASLFCACSPEPDYTGSLSMTEIHDALHSPQIAVTPLMPGWLLEPKDIHLLSHEDRLKLLRIAEKAHARQIPDSYYDQAEHGNRGDDSAQLFYLYASDAQCLGCRVVKGKRILIDDLELTKAQSKELYKLLMPYVNRMTSKMSPEQKIAASAIAAQKAYEQMQKKQKESKGEPATNGMPELPSAEPSPEAAAAPEAAPTHEAPATPAAPVSTGKEKALSPSN